VASACNSPQNGKDLLVARCLARGKKPRTMLGNRRIARAAQRSSGLNIISNIQWFRKSAAG